MSKYSQIVFVQGDGFTDFLDKLNEDCDLAMQYLLQWDNADNDDIRSESSAGNDDYEYARWNIDGSYYLMTWNYKAGYAGLQFVF